MQTGSEAQSSHDGNLQQKVVNKRRTCGKNATLAADLPRTEVKEGRRGAKSKVNKNDQSKHRENSDDQEDVLTCEICAVDFKGMKKVWFYIALYPVRWTAQSALHFPPLADLFIPTPFSASLGSILAMQQLRNDYSLTFPPLSIARYSFIQLSRLRRREVKENAQTSKR